MKRCLWILLLAACSEPWQAEETPPSGLYAAGGGVIDATGRYVIEPRFEEFRPDLYGDPFSEGLAAARLKGRWGFIDMKGGWVIQPQFDYVNRFSDDLAMFRLNGKTGFVDATGKIVIPAVYEEAYSFSDGLAVVKGKGGRRYIDKTGQRLGRLFDEARPLSEGRGAARLGHVWGFVDERARFVIEPGFKGVFDFCDGRSWVLRTDGWALINRNGGVLDDEFASPGHFQDGTAAVGRPGKVGIVDRSGDWIIPPRYRDARPFSDGLAAVQGKGGWGYMNRSGEWVIKPGFGIPTKFNDGLAAVWKTDHFVLRPGRPGQCGFIDRTGKLVGGYDYYSSLGFRGSLAKVTLAPSGNMAYVDRTMKVVWEDR